MNPNAPVNAAPPKMLSPSMPAAPERRTPAAAAQAIAAQPAQSPTEDMLGSSSQGKAGNLADCSAVKPGLLPSDEMPGAMREEFSGDASSRRPVVSPLAFRQILKWLAPTCRAIKQKLEEEKESARRAT